MMPKKEKLMPTQPYMEMETIDYMQDVYMIQGISHFFQFRATSKFDLKIVPDGCIDIIFFYDNLGRMDAYVYGTALEYKVVQMEGPGEYFGVRFLPGFQPAGLGVTQRELVDSFMPLSRVFEHEEILDKLKLETDFRQRVKTFLQVYTQLEKNVNKPFGKKDLFNSIKGMIYESNGKVRISHMQEATGYTERYINKVFVEELGISPKVFCKIIQFQRTLEYLSNGTPEKMTDAAINLGYYDQSQFIRDFKRFCGITPKKYLVMLRENRI